VAIKKEKEKVILGIEIGEYPISKFSLVLTKEIVSKFQNQCESQGT
jgi:hypothetical protein